MQLAIRGKARRPLFTRSSSVLSQVGFDSEDVESTALSPSRGRGLTFVERRRISLRGPFGNRIFALSRGERVDRDRRFHQPARAG